VNPETFVHDKVTNFYGNNNSKPIQPLTAVASQKEQKILGIYFEGSISEGILYFVFLRGGQGLVRKS
jgi:hypothetical protein